MSYLLNPSRFPSAAKFQLPTSASESEDLRNTYFTYYAEGSLMGSLVNKRVLGGVSSSRAEEALDGSELIHPHLRATAAGCPSLDPGRDRESSQLRELVCPQQHLDRWL